jgi:hypothetical protein
MHLRQGDKPAAATGTAPIGRGHEGFCPARAAASFGRRSVHARTFFYLFDIIE